MIAAGVTAPGHGDFIDVVAAEALYAQQGLPCERRSFRECSPGFIVRHEVAGCHEAYAVFIDGVRQDFFDRRQLVSVERSRRTGR